jgi:hypothetical protein
MLNLLLAIIISCCQHIMPSYYSNIKVKRFLDASMGQYCDTLMYILFLHILAQG